MPLAESKKRKMVSLLAEGMPPNKIARILKCASSTVRKYAADPKIINLIEIEKGLRINQKITKRGEQVVDVLELLTNRGTEMQESLYLAFKAIDELFTDVLARTSPEDISPRQIPALAKAMADVANAYCDYADRVIGLESLADEIQKLNETRATETIETSARVDL